MISERTFVRSFGWFWSELLPMMTPHFITLFNEGYQTSLTDRTGRQYPPLPLDGTERPDIVAEFGFRLARLGNLRGLDSDALRTDLSLMSAAEVEALSLIKLYEGAQVAEPDPLSTIEREDGLALCARYPALYSAFPAGEPIEFCPTFSGAGFLNSCEGDIRIGSCLIEVKTTSHRPAGRDIRQLLVYLALDANGLARRWSDIAIFNPRRGALHRIDIDTLILRTSGGKSRSEVFAELIAFAESNEIAIEAPF